MRRFFTVFRMDLGNCYKNPVLVGYNTIFGVFMVLVLGYLSRGNYADPLVPYRYYTITFMVYGMLNGAMTASNCFMERDIKGPNLRIIYSPVGSFPIYFSKIMASFVFDYSLHLLLLAWLCPLLRVSLGPRPYLFVLLMAPMELASAALGTFFCCFLRSEESASTFLSMTISLFSILGGTFFSLDGQGRVLAFLSRLSPVKWLNDAFFALAVDDDATRFWPVFLAGILVSGLLTWGCRLTFRKEDYL